MATRTAPRATELTRAEIEDFLYAEAALLDDWRLDDWLGLLTEDACYYVPSNDRPEGDHRAMLFMIADDTNRIRARVKRLKDQDAHAESPRSRTRRFIANVRILEAGNDEVTVSANFSIHRFRRNNAPRHYVGHYLYRLTPTGDGLRIRERRAVLDSTELGPLGAVSFIL